MLNNPLKGWQILSSIFTMVFHTVHWWEILNFTFPSAKPDRHGGIDTYCRTFCMTINVLIMIIPDDLNVNKKTVYKI